MGGDHLPSEIGKAHPRLALPADEILAAHLELEVHGGEVTAERQDLEPDALLLDPRPRRPRNAVRVDLAEAVPFALAISFEVGVESNIQVYDEIRARLAACIAVSASAER